MNGQTTRQRTTSQRWRIRQRRGAAIVEFALVSIVFFVTVFTCIEFTRFNMIQHLAEDAAYESARMCMVQGAVKQEAIDEANRILGVLGVSSISVTVTPSMNGTDQSEIDDDTTQITVDISIPMSSNTFFVPRFLGDFNIESTTTLAFESYNGYYDGS